MLIAFGDRVGPGFFNASSSIWKQSIRRNLIKSDSDNQTRLMYCIVSL